MAGASSISCCSPLMIVGAGVTYDMKHEAEKAARRGRPASAPRSPRRRRRSSLLKAEWSMLTQPGRLQELVEKYADHFRLEPFAATQIATSTRFRLKPVDAATRPRREDHRRHAPPARPIR